MNKDLDLDKNPPEMKSCGMCWFWANLKGQIKSDIPIQCWALPGGGGAGAKRYFANNSKSKQVLDKNCS